MLADCLAQRGLFFSRMVSRQTGSRVFLHLVSMLHRLALHPVDEHHGAAEVREKRERSVKIEDGIVFRLDRKHSVLRASFVFMLATLIKKWRKILSLVVVA